MHPNEVLLHLSLIENIGPATIAQIKQLKPENMLWHDLYDLSIADLSRQFQLGPVAAQHLYFGLKNKDFLHHELSLIEKHGATITSILDSEYPSLLSHIHAPPTILYTQGAPLAAFSKSLAIIGARASDRYGKQVIETLVPQLVSHGWSIVSGGALGADAMAHAATLAAGGKTLVVLGSGLMHAGPGSNKKLFERILAQNGTLLSTFPMNKEGRPEHFPIRNRVISGLCYGVIVAQAARKSGTRITAQYALEQGRDVFAVPGLIDHPLSEGCHALIQEGAKLISRVEDVLEEYGEGVPSDYATASSDTQFQLDILTVHKEQSQNNFPDIIACPAKLAERSREGHIRSLCRTPISLEDLMRETNVSYTELQTILFDMQLAGLVQQNFAGLWHTS